MTYFTTFKTGPRVTLVKSWPDVITSLTFFSRFLAIFQFCFPMNSYILACHVCKFFKASWFSFSKTHLMLWLWVIKKFLHNEQLSHFSITHTNLFCFKPPVKKVACYYPPFPQQRAYLSEPFIYMFPQLTHICEVLRSSMHYNSGSLLLRFESMPLRLFLSIVVLVLQPTLVQATHAHWLASQMFWGIRQYLPLLDT